MTVGELRKKMEHIPSHVKVFIEHADTVSAISYIHKAELKSVNFFDHNDNVKHKEACFIIRYGWGEPDTI